MAIPTPNTTCDIYRYNHSPPADPDVAGVPCVLIPDFVGGHALSAATIAEAALRWTHILLVGPTTDLRDHYIGGGPGSQGTESIGANPDLVYIPDKNGNQFIVICVERVGRGTAADQKRAFIQRVTTTWPTNDL